MKPVFLDTSAYLKEFSREPGSDAVSSLFGSCENGEVQLAISEWAINEGLAAIDRKHRRGEMTIEERDKIIQEVLRKTRSRPSPPTSSSCRSRVPRPPPR